MLYRVEVNVIHMPRVIVFIANAVLPEPSLPDIRFTSGTDPYRNAGSAQAAHESRFDASPTARVITITFRKRP